MAVTFSFVGLSSADGSGCVEGAGLTSRFVDGGPALVVLLTPALSPCIHEHSPSDGVGIHGETHSLMMQEQRLSDETRQTISLWPVPQDLRPGT